MPETALYTAVKRFLEAAGFQVKGKVGGCDAVAVCDGEPLRLVVVEMKLGFSLETAAAGGGPPARSRRGLACRASDTTGP